MNDHHAHTMTTDHAAEPLANDGPTCSTRPGPMMTVGRLRGAVLEAAFYHRHVPRRPGEGFTTIRLVLSLPSEPGVWIELEIYGELDRDLAVGTPVRHRVVSSR